VGGARSDVLALSKFDAECQRALDCPIFAEFIEIRRPTRESEYAEEREILLAVAVKFAEKSASG
jgi:hypothetical protein